MANPSAWFPLSGAASPASPGSVLPAMGHVFYLKFVTQFLFLKKSTSFCHSHFAPVQVFFAPVDRSPSTIRAKCRPLELNKESMYKSSINVTHHPAPPCGREKTKSKRKVVRTYLSRDHYNQASLGRRLTLFGVIWDLKNHNVNIRDNLQIISVHLFRLVQSLPGVTVDLFLPILTLWAITVSDYQLCLFTLLHIVMVGIISDGHVYRRFPSPYRSIISP